MCVPACVRACVCARALLLSFLCACVRACVRACVCVCVCVCLFSLFLHITIRTGLPEACQFVILLSASPAQNIMQTTKDKCFLTLTWVSVLEEIKFTAHFSKVHSLPIEIVCYLALSRKISFLFYFFSMSDLVETSQTWQLETGLY